MTPRDWAYVSNDVIYLALFLYAISFFFYAFETAFSLRNEDTKSVIDRTSTMRASKAALRLYAIATLFLGLGVLTRGISAGRVPWGNMYEFSITGALSFSVAFLVVGRKYDLRWLGLPISILVLLILGTAITLLYRPSAPLVPALRSTWLVVHVSAAILSGGVFLLANTLSATYLWLDRMEAKGARDRKSTRLNSSHTDISRMPSSA